MDDYLTPDEKTKRLYGAVHNFIPKDGDPRNIGMRLRLGPADRLALAERLKDVSNG